MKIAVIIPTYNGGELFVKCIDSLRRQTVIPDDIVIIDSSSTDNTQLIAESLSHKLKVIASKDFNHGGTRNYGARLTADSDILIFLTQDAILDSDNMIEKIISPFKNDSKIGAICGRQLPHYDANPIARHARLFNYPAISSIRTKFDSSRMGVKVAFMSNSFSAYRSKVFFEMGGFPDNTILAEDMYLTAKMLQAGYKVMYCAEACVRHSHNYTPLQEFRRYFDIGVFHNCEKWIQNEFGSVSGEGGRFVKSELKFLSSAAPTWMPRALITTVFKLIGYKLGNIYHFLPKWLCFYLSMCKSYW